jgi:hypothetical protein
MSFPGLVGHKKVLKNAFSRPKKKWFREKGLLNAKYTFEGKVLQNCGELPGIINMELCHWGIVTTIIIIP